MIRDLARKSRSWRGYDESRKVSREELVEMVECARLCPSSVNMQPLKYYLAWEEEQVKKIQPLTKWARALQPMELPHKGHCPTAFIVICQDTALQPSIPRFQKDIGIVAQTMLLAATEMGLGGCMIGNYDAGQVREALELPEWYGRSLDALYDCLTDLSVPTTIHVENWPEEDYMQRALAVLRDAAEENELLQVRLED